MAPGFRDLPDEDVVVQELLFVASEELLVELEGSAQFVVDLEVSHGFSGFVEFDLVFDLNDS